MLDRQDDAGQLLDRAPITAATASEASPSKLAFFQLVSPIRMIVGGSDVDIHGIEMRESARPIFRY